MPDRPSLPVLSNLLGQFTMSPSAPISVTSPFPCPSPFPCRVPFSLPTNAWARSSEQLALACVARKRCRALELRTCLVDAAELGEQFPTSPLWRAVARRRQN